MIVACRRAGSTVHVMDAGQRDCVPIVASRLDFRHNRMRYETNISSPISFDGTSRSFDKSARQARGPASPFRYESPTPRPPSCLRKFRSYSSLPSDGVSSFRSPLPLRATRVQQETRFIYGHDRTDRRRSANRSLQQLCPSPHHNNRLSRLLSRYNNVCSGAFRLSIFVTRTVSYLRTMIIFDSFPTARPTSDSLAVSVLG